MLCTKGVAGHITTMMIMMKNNASKKKEKKQKKQNQGNKKRVVEFCIIVAFDPPMVVKTQNVIMVQSFGEEEFVSWSDFDLIPGATEWESGPSGRPGGGG